MAEDAKRIIRKYALQNAVLYKGKANPKAVVGKVLADSPELRSRAKELMPLTQDRTKPAVPFGGIYRLVDFTLSNCVNSGIYKIIVLPQYKSQSLVEHLEAGWNIFSLKIGHFLKIVPPQQRTGLDWYRGTADSIRQNLYIITRNRARNALILSGDHIYKMDYSRFLAYHEEKEADVTISLLEVGKEQAHQFGVCAFFPDDLHEILADRDGPGVVIRKNLRGGRIDRLDFTVNTEHGQARFLGPTDVSD